MIVFRGEVIAQAADSAEGLALVSPGSVPGTPEARGNQVSSNSSFAPLDPSPFGGGGCLALAIHAVVGASPRAPSVEQVALALRTLIDRLFDECLNLCRFNFPRSRRTLIVSFQSFKGS